MYALERAGAGGLGVVLGSSAVPPVGLHLQLQQSTQSCTYTQPPTADEHSQLLVLQHQNNISAGGTTEVLQQQQQQTTVASASAIMTPTSAPAAVAASPNNPVAMSQLGTVYATKRRRRNGKR